MAFAKTKTTKSNVDANYHVITGLNLDFLRVPNPILNESNEVIGYDGGARSSLTLSSYKDKDSYLSKSFSLSQKTYEFDFVSNKSRYDTSSVPLDLDFRTSVLQSDNF